MPNIKKEKEKKKRKRTKKNFFSFLISKLNYFASPSRVSASFVTEHEMKKKQKNRKTMLIQYLLTF